MQSAESALPCPEEENVAEKRNTRRKTCLAVLMLLFFLASSTILYPRNVAASDGSGPAIALFTTQEVFAPQQLVTLYANVSYNSMPVAGKLVAFQVEGPANAFENITVFGSSNTTSNGLATFSFRLPWPAEHPEEIVFGNWSAVATVDIAQVPVKGTWTFRVGWILQIISITTLNSTLEPQTTFYQQDIIYFNLTVENVAMIEEPAAITIEAEDAADYPIINITMQELTFQPGETCVIAGPSQVPNTAAIGNATASAAIYNATLPEEGGVLYSPAISAWFEIAETPPIHDVGITSVMVSPRSVYVGEMVQIVVTVKDNGTAIEQNSILSVYYNSSSIWIPIETLPVTLTPGSQESVAFSWNTSSVSAGLYQISAYGALPDNETNPSGTHGRWFVDGFVQVMTPLPRVIHDIGITSIRLATHSVYIGGVVDIYVTVKNNGTATESFGLSTYYNSSLIETLQISALTPGSQESVAFSWNTSSVSAGFYQISASAPLAGDPSPGDNTLIDGFVQVMTPVPYVLFLEVFSVFVFIMAIIAGLILWLMLGFLRRRRKRNFGATALWRIWTSSETLLVILNRRQ
jgi:hypothetical protein